MVRQDLAVEVRRCLCDIGGPKEKIRWIDPCRQNTPSVSVILPVFNVGKYISAVVSKEMCNKNQNSKDIDSYLFQCAMMIWCGIIRRDL